MIHILINTSLLVRAFNLWLVLTEQRQRNKQKNAINPQLKCPYNYRTMGATYTWNNSSSTGHHNNNSNGTDTQRQQCVFIARSVRGERWILFKRKVNRGRSQNMHYTFRISVFNKKIKKKLFKTQMSAAAAAAAAAKNDWNKINRMRNGTFFIIKKKKRPANNIFINILLNASN